jgi:hypothetical protein
MILTVITIFVVLVAPTFFFKSKNFNFIKILQQKMSCCHFFFKLKKYDTCVVIIIFATFVARKHKTYNNNKSNVVRQNIKYNKDLQL